MCRRCAGLAWSGKRSTGRLLASLVSEGERPSEGAEHRFLAPAVGCAAALDGAHPLDESADDGEQEVETQCPSDQFGHGASLVWLGLFGPKLWFASTALSVEVEVLTVPGCPHRTVAMGRVREAVMRRSASRPNAGRAAATASRRHLARHRDQSGVRRGLGSWWLSTRDVRIPPSVTSPRQG